MEEGKGGDREWVRNGVEARISRSVSQTPPTLVCPGLDESILT